MERLTLVLTRKLPPRWLASTVPEGALQAAKGGGGGSHQRSYPAMKAAATMTATARYACPQVPWGHKRYNQLFSAEFKERSTGQRGENRIPCTVNLTRTHGCGAHGPREEPTILLSGPSISPPSNWYLYTH